MRVFADNHQFACKIVTSRPEWKIIDRSELAADFKALADRLFETDNLFESCLEFENDWQALFIVKNAPGSQYDMLIKMSREGKNLPDKILCLADSGREFHGHRNRDWVSLPGNIHLAVYLSPDRPIKNFAIGFTILSAVSVVQTIDEIDDLKGRAGIKWVNDILIENAKVCGFLAHTLSEGQKVSGAVLGIGLNVEASPTVAPTAFVPMSASLRELSQNSSQTGQAYVFGKLISILAKNYKLLLAGGYSELLNIYRQRSVIIGRDVAIFPDPAHPDENEDKVIEGRIAKIGNNLELYLEGHEKPITRGRLILKE